MKCYFTGEECDCGGHLDTECPHDDMTHDDVLEDEGFDEYLASEQRLSEMSYQMEGRRERVETT